MLFLCCPCSGAPINPFLVGGIHTVIRSKAPVTTAELGDQYCMIGPYHEPTVRLEVEVMEPEFSVTKEVVESMKKEGVKVHAISSSNKNQFAPEEGYLIGIHI